MSGTGIRLHPECPSCGTKIGLLETSIDNLLKEKFTMAEIMNKLGIENICCRSRVLSSIVTPLGLSIKDPLRKEKDENSVMRRQEINYSSALFILAGRNDKDLI